MFLVIGRRCFSAVRLDLCIIVIALLLNALYCYVVMSAMLYALVENVTIYTKNSTRAIGIGSASTFGAGDYANWRFDIVTAS